LRLPAAGRVAGNERTLKHGHKRGNGRTRTYASYQAMVTRCTNPKAVNWKRYSGRGVTVADRWRGERGFGNFLADMGERSEGMTLDRIDNDGPH
jgi:hypothetical protein